MRVILAGATGAIGRPLAEALVTAGHDVIGITRSADAAQRHGRRWADAIVADALDPSDLLPAARSVRADAVINELTSLPGTPIRYRDLEPTNRLRIEGTRNLLALAGQVGATRMITQSFLGGYGFTDHRSALQRLGRPLIDEDYPFAAPQPIPGDNAIVAALGEAERLTWSVPGIEGIALRYGFFYGSGGSSENLATMLQHRRLPLPRHGDGTHSYVWLPDAAAATVAALERGVAGQAYNICDDRPVSWNTYIDTLATTVGAPRPIRLPLWAFRAIPYTYRLITSWIPMSNAKAVHDLQWRPTAATIDEGLAADRRGAGHDA